MSESNQRRVTVMFDLTEDQARELVSDIEESEVEGDDYYEMKGRFTMDEATQLKRRVKYQLL